VADLIQELQSYGIEVAVHDPVTDVPEALHEYGIKLVSWQDLQRADALILAVGHKEFLALPGDELNSKMTKPACLVDVKSKLDLNSLKKAGVAVWRL
jgi:UDP-N-acetyl-D-galactosamine dehydrogenase